MIDLALTLKILLTIFLLGLFGLPILLAIWLWYFHDQHIKRLQDEITDIPSKIRKQFEGRGVTEAGISPHIKGALRPLELELEKRKNARQLFLDRAHLISLFKIR